MLNNHKITLTSQQGGDNAESWIWTSLRCILLILILRAENTHESRRAKTFRTLLRRLIDPENWKKNSHM